MEEAKQNVVPEFNLWLFLQSIEWKDPWLIGLVMFHVVITLMAILTRNHGNFQVVLFLMLLLLVYFSENINEVASIHWRTFSRQQYFDNKGLFISLVFSVPILLNCMIMVVGILISYVSISVISIQFTLEEIDNLSGWLYQSSQLMTRLKQAQLRQNQQRKTPPYDLAGDNAPCPQRLKSD